MKKVISLHPVMVSLPPPELYEHVRRRKCVKILNTRGARAYGPSDFNADLNLYYDDVK